MASTSPAGCGERRPLVHAEQLNNRFGKPLVDEIENYCESRPEHSKSVIQSLLINGAQRRCREAGAKTFVAAPILNFANEISNAGISNAATSKGMGIKE